MALSKYAAEIAGRNWLTAQLLRRDIEVAVPVVDRGVDLILFKEAGERGVRSLPLQLKCLSERAFGVDRKYEGRGIPIAYIWNVFDRPEMYVLTYDEALGVLGPDKLKTASWTERGSYVTTSPSVEITAALKRFGDRWEWLAARLDAQPISGEG